MHLYIPCPVTGYSAPQIGLNVIGGNEGTPFVYPTGTEVTLVMQVCSNTKIKDVQVSGPGLNKTTNLNGTREFRFTYVVPEGFSTVEFGAYAPSIPYNPNYPPTLQQNRLVFQANFFGE